MPRKNLKAAVTFDEDAQMFRYMLEIENGN